MATHFVNVESIGSYPELLTEPTRHPARIMSVAFSPVGTRILTGSNDNMARLWDGRTSTPLGMPSTHHRAVSYVAFSPDGTRVLTGSDDKTA